MTGAAGVFEITTQLRGEAGDRQIEGAKVGMAHVIGLGSACGIHILEKSGGVGANGREPGIPARSERPMSGAALTSRQPRVGRVAPS